MSFAGKGGASNNEAMPIDSEAAAPNMVRQLSSRYEMISFVNCIAVSIKGWVWRWERGDGSGCDAVNTHFIQTTRCA